MAERKVSTSRVGRAARLGGVAAGAAARRAAGRDPMGTARALAKALKGMRGAAMKFGQTLSTVDMGLVPEEHREEFQEILADLQQSAGTAPFKDIRKVIEHDLGDKLSALFDDFQEEPIAAASIGQVHRATLDGRDVAVKVQYPGIRDAVRADMQNLGMMLKILNSLAPGIATKAIADELRERIAEELDYELEASNQHAMARAYKRHPFVVVPDVVQTHCTARVMTSEFVDGGRFADVLKEPAEVRDRVGEILVRFYFNGPMHTKLLNGDPHPGNALFLRDGRVAFLDFGFFKRLKDEEVRTQIGTLHATYHRDAPRLLKIIHEAGVVPDKAELAEPLLEHYLGFFGWAIEDDRVTIGPERTGEMMRRYNDMRREEFKEFEVPADHLVLMRCVMLLIGVLGQLRATNNWLDIARDWLFDEEPATELGRMEREALAW